MLAREYEWEFEDEMEGEFEDEMEYEGELEDEGEFEDEGEEFLGSLANFARGQLTALRTPGSWQRNLALRAARAAVSRGVPALAGMAGNWLGGAPGRAAAQTLGRQAAVRLGGLIPQREFEGEFEDEMMLNPARRAFQVANLAHLGNAAANARTEAEAEAFLGALIPAATRLIPRLAPMVMRQAPALIRGVANVGRTLMRSPAARQMIRTVPQIVRGTVGSLARQVAQGRPITAASAVRTLAGQTHRTLASPARAGTAIRRTRAQDRAYHARTGTRACTCRG